MAHAEATPPAASGVKFNPELSLGAVMQAAILLVSIAGWAVTASNRSDQAGKDLASLQVALTGQIDQLRLSTQTGFGDIRGQINSLPDQRARLEGAERQVVDIYARLDAANKRLSDLERQTIEARADINGLMRAANGQLSSRDGARRP